MDRVKELGDASVPFSFDVHAMIFSEDAPKLEKELHRQFQMAQVNRVNPRKEFFRLKLGVIRNFIESREIEAHWTMAAEALEYRESVAMERAGQAGAVHESAGIEVMAPA